MDARLGWILVLQSGRIRRRQASTRVETAPVTATVADPDLDPVAEDMVATAVALEAVTEAVTTDDPDDHQATKGDAVPAAATTADNRPSSRLAIPERPALSLRNTSSPRITPPKYTFSNALKLRNIPKKYLMNHCSTILFQNTTVYVFFNTRK